MTDLFYVCALGHPGLGESSAHHPGRKFFPLFGSNEDHMYIFMHISSYLGSAQNYRKIQFCAPKGQYITLLGINGTCHVGIYSESSREVTAI